MTISMFFAGSCRQRNSMCVPLLTSGTSSGGTKHASINVSLSHSASWSSSAANSLHSAATDSDSEQHSGESMNQASIQHSWHLPLCAPNICLNIKAGMSVKSHCKIKDLRPPSGDIVSPGQTLDEGQNILCLQNNAYMPSTKKKEKKPCDHFQRFSFRAFHFGFGFFQRFSF